MTELHRGSRFSLKATSRRLVFDKSLMQKLDCHRTVHRQVTRTIDRAHSARADGFLNEILVVERPANKRIRCGRCLLGIDHLLEVRLSGLCQSLTYDAAKMSRYF